MLAKRIIPCLDIQGGKVVKGIQFKNHRVVGDVLDLSMKYCERGADELVFYDITASSDHRTVDRNWINEVARYLNIPFCVAGGIRSVSDAESILNAGADKISINSPALENPDLINHISAKFGKQCIIIGIDSMKINNNYYVYQYTGDNTKTINTTRLTLDWIKEVEARGAGEIVLNCMNQDGTRQGYDIEQLAIARKTSTLPLIASGGAGCLEDFLHVFKTANVNGALAASIFHSNDVTIQELKNFLYMNNIRVRL